jgi:hypothetical protein
VGVVFQDHAPSRPDRTRHLPHHGGGIGHVLQKKARVGDVEAAPLHLREWQPEGVAFPQLAERLLAGLVRLAERLGDLNRVAIDAQNRHAARPRHRPGELCQPTADIEDPLTAAQSELP